MVLRVDAADKTFFVSHERIEGLMDSMTMPFEVRDVQLVPDFTLISSSKEQVKLSDFAGRVVANDFIYTRCALPQFCRRMTDTFGVLQNRFASVLGRDLQLLTVTFDPERDTPEVLAAYADGWKADGRGWRFLTGPVTDVRRVCSLFSVDAVAAAGLGNDMVRTVVVGRDRRLLANIEGNQFTPEQLGDLLRSTLES